MLVCLSFLHLLFSLSLSLYMELNPSSRICSQRNILFLSFLYHFIARTAAIKRATTKTTDSSQATPTNHLLAVPSLESLCTKFLISSSRSHGFPSCASLTPMVAQRLLSSLMEEKRLNSRVLASFHGR